MKNKKLLTRLFALLASLVLFLALALPCFAEETDQLPTDYTYKRVYSLDDIRSLLNEFSGGVPCIVYDDLTFSTYFLASGYYDSSSNSFLASWSLVQAQGVYYVYGITINSDAISLKEERYILDGTRVTTTYNLTWTEFELYIFVPVSSSSADTPNPSSDMYSNLFNILKDAVYGSDAELTGSQEYALTLISTILTYATILLPVILVIFIAVWCFKRF